MLIDCSIYTTNCMECDNMGISVVCLLIEKVLLI